MTTKYNFALDSFKNTQELIRFIDQKASAILVVYGFILTAFVDNSKKMHFVNPFHMTFGSSVMSILTLLIGLGLVGLLLYKIHVVINLILRPRLAKNYQIDEYCMFYFDHIDKMEKKDYLKEYDQLELDKMVRDIASQVYEVSKIYVKKSIHLGHVMKYIFHSIALLLIFILLIQFV